MKKYALIVAAGMGTRMQSEIPKQFLLLKNKPVYSYAVNTFLNAYDDIEIYLILPQNYSFDGDAILAHFEKKSQIKIITGGETRFQSVKNGLNEISESGIVFIHDAVRPVIQKNLLDTLYDAALEKGNAIPFIDVNDSLRQIDPDGSHIIDRNLIKAIQTPQVFQTDLIKKAFACNAHGNYTDDASVLEAMGETIYLVRGRDENIKITRPADLKMAEAYLETFF